MTGPHDATCSVNHLHDLHGERATWTTCRPCEDSIRADLTEVESLWPQLPDYLERGRGHSSTRGAAPIHAPLPLAEHVLALIAPGGAHDRLGRHDAAIRTARGLHGAPVTGSADYRMRIILRNLRNHLAWAAANVDLEPLAYDLNKLTREMRAITGDRPDTMTVTTQPCPAPTANGTPCGGRLRLDRASRTITCATCHSDYTPQAAAMIAAHHAATL